jgi:tetratricopeptide (TPR) repeat protein
MNSAMESVKRSGFTIFITALFTLLALGAAFSQTLPPEHPFQLLNKEQPKKAVALLREAAEKTPSAQNWYYLGYALLRTGEPKEALKAFDQGIALDDKSPLNYVGKGRLKLKEGDANEAKNQFDKALALTKSKNIEVLNAIAESYSEDSKFIGTEMSFLQKAEALNSPNVTTSLLLGDAYLQQGNVNGGKAVSSYETAASLNAKDATPYYKMGLVYLRSTNNEVAMESFRKATEIDPTYAPAYKELGELYYLMKKADEAVKAQDKYLQLTEKPEAGMLRYGFYLFMAKNFTKANEVFEQSLQQGTINQTGLRYYAFSLQESGEFARSQKVFEEYFAKAKPEQIEASDYATYGKLLLKLDQDSLAVIAFDKGLAIDGKQVAVLQLKAETLFKEKRYKESVDAYNALMAGRAKPLSQDYYSLGRSYYYDKQFEKADSTFQKLIALQPTMTVGYLWAGRTTANLDPETEQGLAKPYYDKLIEMGLANPDKNKNDLIEAYSYLGYYYFVKKQNALSRTYWEKVLALNPADTRAIEALKAIK